MTTFNLTASAAQQGLFSTSAYDRKPDRKAPSTVDDRQDSLFGGHVLKVKVPWVDDPHAMLDAKNLADASRKLSALRDAKGFGASATLLGFGEVYEGKKLVARISYNGRVWNLDGSEVRL